MATKEARLSYEEARKSGSPFLVLEGNSELLRQFCGGLLRQKETGQKL